MWGDTPVSFGFFNLEMTFLDTVRTFVAEKLLIKS